MKRLVWLVFLLGGCNLYFGGGGGEDDVCYGYGADQPAIELRNPQNGTCQAFGGGECGPCGPCAEAADVAWPDWAVCSGQCEQLAENDCLVTEGCRAAYVGNPAADALPKFLGCWGVAPSGPVHGSCTGLDAQQCSEHDDCSAYYEEQFEDTPPPGSTHPIEFIECFPEAHTTDPGTCYGPITCQSSPTPVCPPGSTPGIANGCYTGQCIPLSECPDWPSCESLSSESDCKARQDCSPVYDGMNCTCTPQHGCHCQSQTYDHCESLAMPL